MLHDVRFGKKPAPELGDVALAFAMSNNATAALSNHVQAVAGAISSTAAPYVCITAPPIVRKSSGIFLMMGWITITATDESSTIVAGDGLAFNRKRDAVVLGQNLGEGVVGAVTSNGATSPISGFWSWSAVDNSGKAIGVATTYSVQLTFCNAGHLSGVNAGQGNIFVMELPG